MPALVICKKSLAWLLTVLFVLSGCQLTKRITPEPEAERRPPSTELKVVPFVDLNRYLGTWYEIARYPHKFQENCYASQANYTMRQDGYIRVINRCWLGGFNGRMKEAEGKAWVIDKTTNARLKVQFFWPFSGQYWVIALDPEYQYAVVGHPTRKYLWILSRSRKMDPKLYAELLEKIKQLGYDTHRLLATPQPAGF